MHSCAEKNRKYESFFTFWQPFLCFANLKMEITKYRMLSHRFEFTTHKLCKIDKWIKNYAQKIRGKKNVLDFSPFQNFKYVHVML